MEKNGSDEAVALRQRVTECQKMMVQLAALDYSVSFALFAAIASLLFVFSDKLEFSWRLAISTFALLPSLMSLAIFLIIPQIKKEIMTIETYLEIFEGDSYSALVNKVEDSDPLRSLFVMHIAVYVISLFLFFSFFGFVMWSRPASTLWIGVISSVIVVAMITALLVYVTRSVWQPVVKYDKISRQRQNLRCKWLKLKQELEHDRSTPTGLE